MQGVCYVHGAPAVCQAVQTQCNTTDLDEVSQLALNTTCRLSYCEEHAACYLLAAD